MVLSNFYPVLTKFSQSETEILSSAAITAMGQTMYLPFLKHIIPYLAKKAQRKTALVGITQLWVQVVPLRYLMLSRRPNNPFALLRFIPMAMQSFNSQAPVKHLLMLSKDTDVTIRLEVIRALSLTRGSDPYSSNLTVLKWSRVFMQKRVKYIHQTLADFFTPNYYFVS